MYNQNQVYRSCLYAIGTRKIVDALAFGKACGASNKGEYKNSYYQEIAGKHPAPDHLTEQQLWELYLLAK